MIITADDFGLASPVNAAIEQCHRQGILTAASLMVGSSAAEEAVRIAKANPKLRVGLHLVLTEARPVLDRLTIPDLVDENGFFWKDMARLGASMYFIPRVRAQMQAEIEAQFASFAATGLPLDHVNAHKHYHMHPSILAHILICARKYPLRGVRVPYESPKLMAQLGSRASYGARAMALGAQYMRKVLTRHHLWSSDRVFGLSWSGNMNKERLAAILRALPEGTSEIYFHPASTNIFPGSAPSYCYDLERTALLDSENRELLQQSDAQLGGFADFCLGGPIKAG